MNSTVVKFMQWQAQKEGIIYRQQFDCQTIGIQIKNEPCVVSSI